MSGSGDGTSSERRRHTLLFLEPGHFHAALTLRVRSPRVHPVIHLYARPGAERDAFISLVRSFNARADNPTDWDLCVHESSAPERALVEERRGNVVVLAGRNQPKLGTIARLHAAGLHVLADKPWLTDPCALPDLERVTEGWPLAMDIMTFRHDAAARLTNRLATSWELFGALSANSDEPAIDLHSVHHLLKVVDGVPLTRPPWYYDTRVQGNGLVDIQSHMADQAQWLLEDEKEFEYGRDCEIDGASLWSTPVPLDLFRASTGLDAFPATLADRVEGDVLCDGARRLPRPARRERMAGGARCANSVPLHAARERVRVRRVCRASAGRRQRLTVCREPERAPHRCQDPGQGQRWLVDTLGQLDGEL